MLRECGEVDISTRQQRYVVRGWRRDEADCLEHDHGIYMIGSLLFT